MRFHYLAMKAHAWALTLLVAPLLWMGRQPRLTPEAILGICASLPEANMARWDDIARIGIRPAIGLFKVTSGSWFGDGVKYGVFLPAPPCALDQLSLKR